MNRMVSTLTKLNKSISIEKAFKQTPEYKLADYFRTQLKIAGYTIREVNWKDTKKAAKEIIEEHNHISIEEWQDCIMWCFSAEKKGDQFWGKVPIVKLSTVIKIHSTYKTKIESTIRPRKVIQYGKKR